MSDRTREVPNGPAPRRADGRLLYAAYSAGLAVAFGVQVPRVLAEASAHGKYRSGLGERLGRYRLPSLGERPLWLHAVSVGEVLAATPLARALRSERPRCPLLVSTVTDTGRAVAREHLPEAAATVFFPLDFSFAVRRALAAVGPRAVLLAETEIWPNFLRACRLRGVPVAILNGRISSRSFRRYRMVRALLGRVLADVAAFGMQTVADAERILALGAPPERVRVTGNLKFDALASEGPAVRRAAVRKDLGLAEGGPVLLAGSTHRGEELAILEAYAALREGRPRLALVLAPRHPERCGEVEGLLRGRGLAWVRRSAGPPAQPPDVILVDTVGELGRLYAAADVAFVGGSLSPVGGHNILEPAAAGAPIVVGPHMENFAEMAAAFRAAEALLVVRDAAGLAQVLGRMLAYPEEAEALAQRGRAVLDAHRGATRRTLDLLAPILG